MFEPTLLDVLAPGEPYMVLSRSGRILQVGPALVDILGANPSGRNLNDLMDEAAVVRLLTEVTLEDILTVDCELCRCFFTCGARLTEEGNIMLVFKLLRDLRDEGENRLLVRYMGIQIAELVDDLSIAIERLSGEHTEACSQARSAAEKNLWNLLRIARNAPLKADFGIDGPPKLARPGDLAVFLADLLRHTAEVLAPYHDLGIELEVDSLPCVYDELNIRRAVLNLLAYAIHRNTLPRARMQFGVSRSGDQLILRLQAAGPARDPLLGPGGVPVYGQDLELEVASILLRAVGGNMVSTTTGDSGWLCRANLPIVPDTGDKPFSSLVLDWYGGRDPVLFELSGVLPAGAYQKGE